MFKNILMEAQMFKNFLIEAQMFRNILIEAQMFKNILIEAQMFMKCSRNKVKYLKQNIHLLPLAKKEASILQHNSKCCEFSKGSTFDKSRTFFFPPPPPSLKNLPLPLN